MTTDEALAWLGKKIEPMAEGFVIFVPPRIRPPEYVAAIEAGLALRAELERRREAYDKLHQQHARAGELLEDLRQENAKLRDIAVDHAQHLNEIGADVSAADVRSLLGLG